jgi:hypothetical protein
MVQPRIPNRTEGRPDTHTIQAQFALAAFSTLKAENLTYVSVPITSGPRLYQFMEKYGVATLAEAKKDHERFLAEVIEPNMADGVKQSGYWSEKLKGAVIAPAEFDGRLYRAWGKVQWNADDFMGMWVPLIEEKITNMAMLNGWEYSNGCGEEYLTATLMQMGRRPRSNITVNDAEEGRLLNLDEGIGLMANAFKDIISRGIFPRNMAETLGILLESERRFYTERNAGFVFEPAATSPGAHELRKTNPTLEPYDHGKVRAIAAEVEPLINKHFPDIMPKLKKTSSYDFSPVNAIFRDTKPAEGTAPVQAPKALAA